MSARKIQAYQLSNIGISLGEINQLNALTMQHASGAWDLSEKSKLTLEEKQLVKKIKNKIKHHLYYSGQGGYCCYCGHTIDEHKGSHDAEHCIAKDGKALLVFNTKNIALSCKPCNGNKGVMQTRIFTLNDELDEVSEGSDKYRVVNPHFDAWNDHLAFDKYRRVVAINNAEFSKGRLTIKLFNIHRKNAMALADYFDIFRDTALERENWLDFYTRALSEDDSLKKTKYKKFLTKIINMPSDPAADGLRAALGTVLDP